MLLLLNIGTARVIWFGGVQVTQDAITIGEIIAMITYLTQMLSTLVMVSMLLIVPSVTSVRFRRAGSSRRLNTVPEGQDRPNAAQDHFIRKDGSLSSTSPSAMANRC